MDEYNNQYSAPNSGEYTAPESSYVEPYVEETAPNNTFGIISMICGIASIIISCCCTWIAIPLAIAAVVLAFVDKSKNGKMSGFSIAGLICGGIGIVSLILNFVIGIVMGAGSGILSALMESGSSSYYY